MGHPLILTAMSVLVLLAIWCVLPACASVSTVPMMTVAPSQVTGVTRKLSSAGHHPFIPIFLSGQLLWSCLNSRCTQQDKYIVCIYESKIPSLDLFPPL